MICKACKKTIDDDSLYCKFCGERQVKERKKKTEISVPKPRQLKSGEWVQQVMHKGEVEYIRGSTEAEYYAKARAWKSGLIEAERTKARTTVGQLVDKYISSNTNVLSPSTMRGYKTIRDNRFQEHMSKDALSIDWQAAVNEEAVRVSPKTLANSWRLITASYKLAKLPVPSVNLPKIPKADRPWLDYEQIQTFLKAAKGEPGELGALLALHSLRRSEIMSLTAESIQKGTIRVRGATVYNAEQKLVSKETNKSAASTRDIPIMIPRLLELLPESGKLIEGNPNTLWRQINKLCKTAGLPEVGVHGLRHSFASLAYHLGWPELQTMAVGGWSNFQTVHNIYTHLAQQDRSDAVKNMIDFYSNS